MRGRGPGRRGASAVPAFGPTSPPASFLCKSLWLANGHCDRVRQRPREQSPDPRPFGADVFEGVYVAALVEEADAEAQGGGPLHGGSEYRARAPRDPAEQLGASPRESDEVVPAVARGPQDEVVVLEGSERGEDVVAAEPGDVAAHERDPLGAAPERLVEGGGHPRAQVPVLLREQGLAREPGLHLRAG